MTDGDEDAVPRWIAMLRVCGVKAAQADDEWVDHGERSINLGSAYFDDRPQIGDLVALGSRERFRVVRVVGTRRSTFFSPWADRLLFEEIEG